MSRLIKSLIEWNVKFSKIITVVCLGMSVMICLWAMVCHTVGRPADPSVIGVLLAPWQLELGFNMSIKIFDLSKEKKKKEDFQNE